MSFAIFIRLTARVRNLPARFNQGILRGLRFKMIGRFTEMNSRFPGDNAPPLGREIRMAFNPVPTAVPPKATRSELPVARFIRAMPNSICRHSRRIPAPGELGVASCKMGAADFDDGVEVLGLLRQRLL
jgi:hypothetical protein